MTIDDIFVSIALSPAALDGAGLSLPTGVGSRAILLDTDISPYYLPQHELFHQVQYEYIGVPNLLTERWWMEATAEWAAHQALIDLEIAAEPVEVTPTHATDQEDSVVAEPEPHGDEGFLPPMRGQLDDGTDDGSR